MLLAVGERRQHDDADGAVVRRDDPPRRLDAVHARHRRGPSARRRAGSSPRELDRLRAVRGRADDLDVVVVRRAARSRPARTTGWSSASSDADHHSGASTQHARARARADVRRSSVPPASRARSPSSRRPKWPSVAPAPLEARAVVGDRQPRAVVVELDAHVDVRACECVATLRSALLRAAVEQRLRSARAGAASGTSTLAVDPACAERRDEVASAASQARAVEVGRVDVDEQRAQLADRAARPAAPSRRTASSSSRRRAVDRRPRAAARPYETPARSWTAPSCRSRGDPAALELGRLDRAPQQRLALVLALAGAAARPRHASGSCTIQSTSSARGSPARTLATAAGRSPRPSCSARTSRTGAAGPSGARIGR